MNLRNTSVNKSYANGGRLGNHSYPLLYKHFQLHAIRLSLSTVAEPVNVVGVYNGHYIKF